jgi:melibiose permease/lactose/raffinose/galactose permease
MILSGILLPGGMGKFWLVTIGYTLSMFGQYGYYLILMIAIINTVEYNEYKNGERDEAIITSMRPFLTKMASAIVVGLTYLTYMIFRVTEYTNQISELEQQANTGVITSEAKNAAVDEVLKLATHGQSVGMLLFMVFLPMIFMLLAFFLYKKFYKLDEDEYDRICAEIESRKAAE